MKKKLSLKTDFIKKNPMGHLVLKYCKTGPTCGQMFVSLFVD